MNLVTNKHRIWMNGVLESAQEVTLRKRKGRTKVKENKGKIINKISSRKRIRRESKD